MARPTNRLTEEIGVGFYLLVSLLGAMTYLGVQVSNGPFIGGSYLVIAVFWLCVCAVVATALVVVFVNGYRVLQDTTADWIAVGFAALILASIAGALFLAFLANRLQTAMVVGVVGLIIAPLGLFATVFKPRLRHLFGKRLS